MKNYSKLFEEVAIELAETFYLDKEKEIFNKIKHLVDISFNEFVEIRDKLVEEERESSWLWQLADATEEEHLKKRLYEEIFEEHRIIPRLTVMVGIPASGKSTYTAKIPNAITLSSDAIRAELYGDESVQKDHAKVFNILYERMNNYLKEGKDVVIDATSLTKETREFIREAIQVECLIRYVVMCTPLNICLERNSKRERKVPEDVIKRMNSILTIPDEEEGGEVLRMWKY